jgi:hypothetical protein
LLFEHHGYVFWDDDWYAGRYGFISYSISYYPLAALVGIRLLALASVAAASAFYAGAVRLVFGEAGRWSVLPFSVLTGALVLSAAYPFVLGEAFGMAALWSLALGARRSARPVPGRRPRAPSRVREVASFAGFVLAATAALSASPLALAGVALVVAAALVALPRRRTIAAFVVVAVLAALELVLLRAFPGEGFYPFWGDNLAEALGFSAALAVLAAAPGSHRGAAACWGQATRRPAGWRAVSPGQAGRRAAVRAWGGLAPTSRLRVSAAAVFAVASVAAFVIPSPLGANLVRVREAALAAVTVAAATRGFRPRWLVALALVGAAFWNVAPLASAFVEESSSAEAHAWYWRPAVAFLEAHLRPSFRVEVVDTVGHDGAFFLPEAGIPIARGWFRQQDFPTNAILYRPGPLRPAAYRAWLRGLGVAYVVRTDAPPDFSAAREAALLRSGRSGLRVVLRAQHLTIYAVPHPTPIVTGPGPARIVRLGVSHLTVALGAPGAYRLALHWSPYWHSSLGCVTRAAGGMTELVVRRPGVARLGLRITPARLWSTVLGEAPPACRLPTGTVPLSSAHASALR